MNKYISAILFLTLFLYSAQQKRLINGQWSLVGISGIYNKKSTSDNNMFPFRGNTLSSANSILIDNLIDFNSSNNNPYHLYRNSFDLKDVEKYNARDFLNSKIDTYRLSDTGNWEFYSSKNLSSGSNDFTDFEIGKSYWLKATSANPDSNISIILDNHLDILSQYSLSNGWNFMSLNDDILEHSASAFFLPDTITLPFTISRIYNLSPITITGANIIEAAQSINHQSFLEKINGEPLHMRAYPAIKEDGTVGIIVISNTLMNISNRDALPLSGGSLQSDINGNLLSNIEHIISFKLDLNISSAYESKLKIMDLNGNIDSVDLQNNDINNMTNTIVEKAKDVLKTSNVTGYTVMIDFDNKVPVYDNILIASDKSFGLSESFYTRKFEYIQDGNFFVSGADAQEFITPSDINKISDSTGIIYHNLGGNEFEISSYYRSDLDLFKNDANDLFKKIDNSNEGYITKVYKALNLYGAYVKDSNITPLSTVADNGLIDEVPYAVYLDTRPIYSESANKYRNLQKLFLLDKRAISLYTAESSSGSLFWRTMDFTKESNWFDEYDRATLFVNNKEFGYYVYLNDKVASPPIIRNFNVSLEVSPHFNNDKTYNFARYNITFEGENLAPDKRYVAYLGIAGKAIHVYDKDGKFSTSLDNEFLNFQEGQIYPMNLKIANNTGALFFKDDLSLFYYKPTIKSATITGNSLEVETDYDYEVYDGKINEINRKETLLGTNLKDLSTISSTVDLNSIKVVAKDVYGFYSDVYTLGYVPDNNSSTLKVDNERRNGITLKIINNSNMTLSFNPIDESKLIVVAAKTMYLKVENTVIGSVTYDLAHKNNKFFVVYDGRRYDGIFQDNDDYNSDSSAYELKEIE